MPDWWGKSFLQMLLLENTARRNVNQSLKDISLSDVLRIYTDFKVFYNPVLYHPDTYELSSSNG